ncbi:hypothetical protein Tco_1271049, partial [Tanacetum coccineum]
LECVEARLLVYKKNNSIYEEDIKIVDKCKTGLGYNAVPPPYTGNFMPPKPYMSFFGLEEFTSEPIVIKPMAENSEAKASKAKPKAVRKNNGAPIIEDWCLIMRKMMCLRLRLKKIYLSIVLLR